MRHVIPSAPALVLPALRIWMEDIQGGGSSALPVSTVGHDVNIPDARCVPEGLPSVAAHPRWRADP
jgi:hypothetical protein